ncbi:MAG: 1-phosphofructokinase [Lachnospiraceae bacterium]|nr:1-phosphofructokinase [Lachnospiraceae bacterium]
MIYTVTFNPSIDYIVSVDHFETGKINRTTDELILPGGKGVNVSIMLKGLGFDSTALGFVSGFTGAEIERLLREQGIKTGFIEVPEGISRINLKLRSDDESEINGIGPTIRDEDIKKLYDRLDELKEGDILVLAGSIPSMMPESVYMDIMRYLENRKLRIVVDAAKELLTNVLPLHPFLIKPNNYELGEIFGVRLRTRREALPYAKRLQKQGALNVLVSMAGEGALLIAEDGRVYESKAPRGMVKNSVGAGDSMVAGFIAGYLLTGSYERAFYLGLCAGSASAFSDVLATGEEVNNLLALMGQELI